MNKYMKQTKLPSPEKQQKQPRHGKADALHLFQNTNPRLSVVKRLR